MTSDRTWAIPAPGQPAAPDPNPCIMTRPAQSREPHGRNGTAAGGQHAHARDPQVDMDQSAVAELVADVATVVGRQAAAMSEDVYKEILGEIPQLDQDKPLRALLASSIDSNVAACLQIMQHRIDLAAVRAPTVATEHARRLAQRGIPLTALLRAYRLGHACFSDWLLTELAEHTGNAEMMIATTLSLSRIVAATSTRPPKRWSLPTPGRGRTGCGNGAPRGRPGSGTCCPVSGST